MTMRITLLLLFTLGCGGGAVPTAEPPKTPQEQPKEQPREQPKEQPREQPKEPSKEITIESIDVANPVLISGRARTFENHVALRVRDARGALIAEDYTTAAGDMGTHNPYRGSVWLTRDPGARITVEALEYSAKDGSERSLVKESRAFDVEPMEIALVFPDRNCTKTLTFTRAIPKTQSVARVIVEALLRGPLPGESGAATAFPRGSALRSVNLRDGVITVDFNERLQNVGGACYAEMIRETVTASLKKLPTVKDVVITAGGSRELALQP